MAQYKTTIFGIANSTSVDQKISKFKFVVAMQLLHVKCYNR